MRRSFQIVQETFSIFAYLKPEGDLYNGFQERADGLLFDGWGTGTLGVVWNEEGLAGLILLAQCLRVVWALETGRYANSRGRKKEVQRV